MRNIIQLLRESCNLPLFMSCFQAVQSPTSHITKTNGIYDFKQFEVKLKKVKSCSDLVHSCPKDDAKDNSSVSDLVHSYPKDDSSVVQDSMDAGSSDEEVGFSYAAEASQSAKMFFLGDQDQVNES